MDIKNNKNTSDQIRIYSTERQRNLTFEELIGTIQDEIQTVLQDQVKQAEPLTNKRTKHR